MKGRGKRVEEREGRRERRGEGKRRRQRRGKKEEEEREKRRGKERGTSESGLLRCRRAVLLISSTLCKQITRGCYDWRRSMGRKMMNKS